MPRINWQSIQGGCLGEVNSFEHIFSIHERGKRRVVMAGSKIIGSAKNNAEGKSMAQKWLSKRGTK